MKQTVNFSQFVDTFKAVRPNNFSYDGLRALFDYLEEYEEDTGEEIEFDVIAICCDYSEYASIKEFRQDYSEDYETIEDIEKETTVIKIDGDAFIIQQF